MSRLLTACCLSVIFLSGCKTTYSPNMINTPLFKQQGELHASLDKNNLQIAYAVSPHVGVMVNGYYRSEENSNETNREEGSGYVVEGGAGYFTPLDPDFLFEFYAGLGTGQLRFKDSQEENGTPIVREYSANGTKFFFQPGIGYTNPYFDIGFSARLVGLSFSDPTTTNYSEEDLRSADLLDLEKPLWFFVEPAITIRGGYKWIKAQVQLGHSFKVNSEVMRNDKTIFTVGLHLHFWSNDD